MFKNLKNQKDEADVMSNFGPALLTAIFVLIVITLFASWMSNLEKRNDVQQIARQYMLRMETTGGLTVEDERELRIDLADYCANVSLDPSGKHTTRAGEVQYGEDIDLYISADLYTYNFGIQKGQPGTIWQLTNDDVVVEDGITEANSTQHTTKFVKHYSSTSKH